MEAGVVELDAVVSGGSTTPVVLALAPGTFTGFCSAGYWSWNIKDRMANQDGQNKKN